MITMSNFTDLFIQFVQYTPEENTTTHNKSTVKMTDMEESDNNNTRWREPEKNDTTNGTYTSTYKKHNFFVSLPA